MTSHPARAPTRGTLNRLTPLRFVVSFGFRTARSGPRVRDQPASGRASGMRAMVPGRDRQRGSPSSRGHAPGPSSGACASTPGTPSAAGVVAEEPAHAQLDHHRLRTDRGIGQPAPIAAVYSVRTALASRTCHPLGPHVSLDTHPVVLAVHTLDRQLGQMRQQTRKITRT